MKEINNWFKFAYEDLTMAKAALKQKVYNQVCFHSQQGVEKMLKGFLRSKKQFIPKTHFLDELLKLCIDIEPQFKTLKEKCSILDDYYIPTRYPEALPGMLPNGFPTEKHALEALSFLKKIMKFVKAKLKK
ncbi:MAG: HEPN domain-containing protein [Candidatus Omnitrophota bacterium]|nr:HEPN domain-containing protein [Candidatus Omnitrophota bacterium]